MAPRRFHRGRRAGRRRRRAEFQHSDPNHQHPPSHNSQPSPGPSQPSTTNECSSERSRSSSLESGEIIQEPQPTALGLEDLHLESRQFVEPASHAWASARHPRDLFEPTPSTNHRRELFEPAVPTYRPPGESDYRPRDLFDSPAPTYHRRELFDLVPSTHQSRVPSSHHHRDSQLQGLTESAPSTYHRQELFPLKPSELTYKSCITDRGRNNQPRFSSDHPGAEGASPPPMMDRDSRSRRYDDGEVTRYGAVTVTSPADPRDAVHEVEIVEIATAATSLETDERPGEWATAGEDVIEAVVSAEALRDDPLFAVVPAEGAPRRADSRRDVMTEIDYDLPEEASSQDVDLDLPLKEIAVETDRLPDVHPRLLLELVPTELAPVVRNAETIGTAPHTADLRRDDRSRPQSPIPSRPLSRSSYGLPTRERSPQGTPKEQPTGPRSPPRGPAALRAPPTGPRDTRTYGSQSGGAIGPPPRPAPIVPAASSRPDISPGVPPAGPRGYVPSRGGGYSRGGRGGSGWGSTIQSRNLPPAAGPVSASATSGSSSIPTGPRAGPSSQSVPSTPVNASSKPFNPPKGPAAESNRPSLAQQLLATIPPIIPGGKPDPRDIIIQTGVLPELQAHYQQLREEEEKIRAEKYVKEEKLRKNLAMWDRMEREAKVLDLRLELSEKLMKKFAGDGPSGAAF
ncbi:hypothetical protein F5Y13DRAFT_190440 [Hypoxylon sp. FL1857]|nr:hypothetical protein F5Y13DRAFT_190440 [Hypoxylon sp. FL1857]